MTTFTGTRAAALTWTAGGHCRGLAVRRSGRTCRVVACWEADAGADSSVAETLANGLRALGLGESTVLVVGAEDLAAGVVDLDIPALRADELRHAVAFELRRQAPLPDDRLAWAYRVIPGAGNGKLHVRLYYLRQAVWERWLNDISGLGRGVDAVIPPVAALDPILGDTPVAFGNAENGFLFAPRVGGCREAAPLDPGAAGPPAFGAGEGPLASPWLQPGPLQELPAGRQRGFVSCAVLAMYGLSRTLVADRRTGFELPYELSPRRHRLSRILAAALLIYACAVAVFGGIRVYRERLGRFEGLRRQRLAAEERIDRLSKRLDGDEGRVMQELRTEFSELSRPRPSMTAALVEITRRVGLGGWCTAFRWRDGSISIQLREQQELEELERLLETSPLLGDVRQEYKKVQGGVIDRKVEMNARYDLENEQSEPPPPRERPPEEADEEIPLDDLLPLDEAGAPDPEDAPPASLQVAPGARRRPLDMRVQGLTPPPPPPSMMPPGEER